MGIYLAGYDSQEIGRLPADQLAGLAETLAWKRDAVVFRVEAPEPGLELEWTDPQTPREGDFYYLRVTETDGHMAWTSPIYVP